MDNQPKNQIDWNDVFKQQQEIFISAVDSLVKSSALMGAELAFGKTSLSTDAKLRDAQIELNVLWAATRGYSIESLSSSNPVAWADYYRTIQKRILEELMAHQSPSEPSEE